MSPKENWCHDRKPESFIEIIITHKTINEQTILMLNNYTDSILHLLFITDSHNFTWTYYSTKNKTNFSCYSFLTLGIYISNIKVHNILYNHISDDLKNWFIVKFHISGKHTHCLWIHNTQRKKIQIKTLSYLENDKSSVLITFLYLFFCKYRWFADRLPQ